MLFVAGIDPGLSGAIAIYDQETDGLVTIWDTPTVKVQIGGSTRKRLDMPELRGMFDTLIVMDVKLICLERVQGYGGKEQSASGAFQFGEVFGRMMTLAEEVSPVDAPAPSVWKMREKVSTNEEAIVKKAEAEFPTFAHLFRGPKGGPLHDRAEAAFLARYAARRIWPMLSTKASIDDLGIVDIDKLVAPKYEARKRNPAIVVDPKPARMAKPQRTTRGAAYPELVRLSRAQGKLR